MSIISTSQVDLPQVVLSQEEKETEREFAPEVLDRI